MNAPYPIRKAMCHTPQFPADDAWYFITVCAAGHRPWKMTKPPHSRKNECVVGEPIASPSFADIAAIIMNEARENHVRGIWRLSLFLVMPDHIHAIMHTPTAERCGGREHPPADAMRCATALPLQHRPVGMARIIADFKHLLSARYGLAFQRDFFDTRIRDDAHYGEKFRYICATPRSWPHVIAFDRFTGIERPHRQRTVHFPPAGNPPLAGRVLSA